MSQFSQRLEEAVKREPGNVAVSTPKKFTKNRCAEFYRHQIAEKLSLKFPLCFANLVRLMQAVVFFFFGPSSSVCSTEKKIQIQITKNDVSVQPTRANGLSA